jgi:DNA (cytosine-5)-methyltransferase 1
MFGPRRKLSVMIPVIDIFAGPGGLNEGFSSVGEDTDAPIFSAVASFEMDSHAHETLVLRGVYRALRRQGRVPESYYDFVRGITTWEAFSARPEIAPVLERVRGEVHQIELGPETREQTDALITKALSTVFGSKSKRGDWVLIGGPPCQAYSLVGRSRQTKNVDFKNDKKHFLYREYLHIIKDFAPTVFVMENVKGLLSSRSGGEKMFDRILRDLSSPGNGLAYEVRSLVVEGSPDQLEPRDFVIRAEQFGIPQKRHRVILLGVRKDTLGRAKPSVMRTSTPVNVQDAIGDLPKLRSGITPMRDNNWETWSSIRDSVSARLCLPAYSKTDPAGVLPTGGRFQESKSMSRPSTTYEKWVFDPNLGGVTLHETRRHMASDLVRYGILSEIAVDADRSPSLADLPPDLLPAHENLSQENAPFLDRFKVQIAKSPSTTVVSHIAKDGHYYIHHDPMQMRSLTVREAARLQTFPDNYFFRGTRTQQYSQVGNAVPPLLAFQIAKKVAEALGLNLSAPNDSGAVETVPPTSL